METRQAAIETEGVDLWVNINISIFIILIVGIDPSGLNSESKELPWYG
jgi:hypothetical protein